MLDTTQLDNIIVGRVNPHIYAFTTETIPNYLKVGDTYRPVETRLNEWRKHFANPVVSEPKSVTAHTHYVIEGVHNKQEAENLADYLKTRFARFMIFLLRSNQNMRVDMYQFVPRLDFTNKWTDEMLYERYGLDDEDIQYIKDMIKEK